MTWVYAVAAYVGIGTLIMSYARKQLHKILSERECDQMSDDLPEEWMWLILTFAWPVVILIGAVYNGGKE